MNNPYRSGIADVWYSGSKKDVWVEYKFIPHIPVRSTAITPECSSLQFQWLRERYKEGRSVFVIIGCPKGGVILSNLEWETPLSVTDFKQRIQSRQEIAAWLTKETQETDGKRTRHLRDSGRPAATHQNATHMR